MLSTSCLSYNLNVWQDAENDFYVAFYGQILLPLFIAGITGMMLLYEEKFKTKGGGVKSDTELPEHQTDQEPQAAKKSSDILGVAVFALEFVYPSVCITCFRIFQCDAIVTENDDDGQWLKADRRIKCFGVGWYVAMAFSLVTIIYFVIGLPVAIFCILRHFKQRKQYQIIQTSGASSSKSNDEAKMFFEAGAIRKADEGEDGEARWTAMIDGTETQLRGVTRTIIQDDGSHLEYHCCQLEDPIVRAVFGRLYQDFEEKYYWWHSVRLCALFSMSGCVIIVQIIKRAFDSSYALLAAIVFTVLQAIFQPYEDICLDRLELANYASVMMSMFLICMQQNSSIGVSEGFSTTIMWILMLFVLYAAYTVGLFLNDAFLKRGSTHGRLSEMASRVLTSPQQSLSRFNRVSPSKLIGSNDYRVSDMVEDEDNPPDHITLTDNPLITGEEMTVVEEDSL
eukprot:gene23863-28947_t